MAESLEAVLLSGGASRRMGVDKSSLQVEGESLGPRIARQLATRAERVVVLGRAPIEGFEFLEDEEKFAGPLAALARFEPQRDLVFVSSCDLPLFDPGLIDEFLSLLETFDAVIPVRNGREQPLCALYRSHAFASARALSNDGEKRLMVWLGALNARKVDAQSLRHADACANANTPQDMFSLGLGVSPQNQ